jgi:prepilin-type N-terminal cleavage/methylation domain-containing protein
VNRRGFSLIELLVSLTVLGILANLALPTLTGLRRRAEAAHIIADVHAVRLAAHDHFVGTGTYPAAGQWGVVPPTLAPSLPDGFEFRYRDAAYRWERWLVPDGLPSDPSQTVLLGLTVRANDAPLMAAVRALYRGRVSFGSATEITFVLE